ncbi:MAG: ketosteroid isomerase-related protein [Xanthobacteraceae bacterium]
MAQVRAVSRIGIMSKVDVVKTHIEVENQHDMEAMLATLVDEDPVREEIAGKTFRGRDAVAGRYAALWEAFPDFTVTPQLFVEDENNVAMEAIYTGTHRGVFNGYPATGKSFRLKIVVIFRFDGSRIASESIYLDYASQLRQLGIADLT